MHSFFKSRPNPAPAPHAGASLLAATPGNEAPDLSSLIDKLDNISDRYLCPISFEFINDAVLALDGHLYERSWINDWIEKDTSSPLNRKKLDASDLAELMPEQQAQLAQTRVAYNETLALLKGGSLGLAAAEQAVAEYERTFETIHAPKAAPAPVAPPAPEKSGDPVEELRGIVEALPDEYECPVTHDLIEEAVVSPHGKIFDKVAIEKWLDTQAADSTRARERRATTCPITRYPLSKSDLLPIPRFQDELDEFREAHEGILGRLDRGEGNLEEAVANYQVRVSDIQEKYGPVKRILSDLKLDLHCQEHLAYWQKQTYHFLGLRGGVKLDRFGKTYTIPNGIEKMMQYLLALKVIDIDSIQRDLNNIREQRSQVSFFGRYSRNAATRHVYEAESLLTASLPHSP